MAHDLSYMSVMSNPHNTEAGAEAGPAWIAVAGAEAAAFLDRLLTVNVSKLAGVGDVCFGALLTPQGKVQHALHAVCTAQGYRLRLPDAARAPAFMQRLNLLKLRADVTLEPLSPDAAEADLSTAADLLPPADAVSRIAAGLPQQGADYATESLFPTDVNMDLLGGVDYVKGCFIGQEVASRMKRRGSIRKRTLILDLQGADAVPLGVAIAAGDGARVGETLSSAGGLALAVVRLDRLAQAGGLDADLAIDGTPARARFPDYMTAEARTLGPASAGDAPA